MKVLLKVDVDNLGYAGEVHNVADGYGRNYLIPQGLAVKATRSVMRQADAWRKAAESRRAELRAEYEELAARIGDLTLTFTARAGESGKLYGSVTTAQITDQLNEKLGTEIDRRKVGIEPLRQLGEHRVPIRLSADFHPLLSVMIEPEGVEDWSPDRDVEDESSAEDEAAEQTESAQLDDESEVEVAAVAEVDADVWNGDEAED